jgi:MFS family permease
LIHPDAVAPGSVSLLGIFAFNGFLMFLPLYSREVGMSDAGPVFATASATVVVVRVLFGRVPDLVGPLRTGAFALGLTMIAALVVAFWSTPAGLFAGAVLLACGLSLQSPSLIAIALDRVKPGERGSAMATFTGFFDVANTLVGPAFGMIVSGLDYRAAFVTSSLMAGAALVVLRTVVAPRWRASARGRSRADGPGSATPPHGR